ncbi:diaminopimelate decarboxylase [Pseudohaliea rubra]|uniref:Diaminopimelate decarboxylase n=1 Tax=Pseudohaliea rubra DSM 19751 TaxID=1265313 RepID=A0A095VSF1_9GAMM|nr:diaminopimelate decarboxylase [Pseudohaliea rubra]KGE04013.1 Diaminopimelate decarboxylase [Pseudohaliea rubra DSM 19751]
MSAFQRRDGELFVEAVALTAIAGAEGTPCYVYSRAAMEAALDAYQSALAGCRHLVCYAVKANSNLAVLDLLARRGAGFDIVSGGELERVVAAGGDPAKVVFSGVGKQAGEMARALELGIRCFNVESPAELELLDSVARAHGVIAPVSLRVNPDVDAETHPYISTGLKENKFGIDSDGALAVYRRAAELAGLRIVGMDCHIGSQLTSTGPFLDAVARMLELVDQLADEGITLRHLDVGGGLGVRYRDEQPPAIGQYIAALRAAVGERDLELVFEPGRSIVANAGVLLTTVNYLKHSAWHNFALVDAAMNDFIRPALYEAWVDIETVSDGAGGETGTWDVVGPVCETADFLGRGRELTLRPGSLLAVRGAGAYGFVMSSNYNTRPRAAEVLVDGEQWHVVRERETLDDLLRGERRLPN